MERFYGFALLLWKLKILEYLGQLKEYGVPGLFAITLLDSALIPMPAGPDVLLVTFALQSTVIQTVGYIAAATIGSVIGCLILYMIAQRGGEKVLQKVSLEKRNYVQGMLGRYDALAIVLASIMPPPFPFKPFILVAGVVRFKIPRLIAALAIGRALRYSLLAVLALYFGEATIGILKKYGVYILIGVVVAVVIVFLVKKFGTKPTPEPEAKKVVDEQS